MTKSASFRKIWKELHKYSRTMAKKSNKNKTRKGKSRKLKKTHNSKGGFIRAGSTQHFYAPCNTNEVILDKNNQTFQQKMDSVNTSQMAVQPNIYSVNGRDINIAADTNRSRYH